MLFGHRISIDFLYSTKPRRDRYPVGNSFTNGAQLNSFAEKNELAPARTKSSFRDSAAIVFLKLCSYWINEKLKSFSLLFALSMSLYLNRKKNRNICPKIKFRFKKMRSSSYRVTGSMYYSLESLEFVWKRSHRGMTRRNFAFGIRSNETTRSRFTAISIFVHFEFGALITRCKRFQ